jgi:phosphoglycerol transferase MdoB-like AlkP superfamily enzyme
VGALAVGVVTGAYPFVSVAFVLLAGQYTASLLTQNVHEQLAALLFATLFFVAAELAYWSLELRTRSAPEPEVLLQRFALLGGLALGALASSGIVLAAAAAAPAPSLLLEVVGITAAVGIAALLVRAR